MKNMPTEMNDAFRTLTPFYVPPKSLDLTSMKELPESHEWILSDNYPSVNTESMIPIVDLDSENVVEQIGHACKMWGIFNVVNHNIRKGLLDEMQEAGKRLFELPMEQKLKAERPPNGVSGYGKPRNSAFTHKLTWSEGFTIVGSPLEHARQLWPTNYKIFCDLVEEYEKEMRSLSERIMWLMMGSLGITKGDINWVERKSGLEDGPFAIQLNSYPTCPDPDRAMGLAPHTDSGIFTILHQNNTSGLQILQNGCEWITVPPLSGALVVGVGDLLHILSNGLYKSVFHRAVVNHSQYRLSIAYFYGPPLSVEISPLPKLVDHTHPPLYRAITWTEYVAIKAKYFDKALSSINISKLDN